MAIVTMTMWPERERDRKRGREGERQSKRQIKMAAASLTRRRAGDATKRSPGYCFSLSYSHKVARERERHREGEREGETTEVCGEVSAHTLCVPKSLSRCCLLCV